LADQFKILRNKYKFPWKKNSHNITEFLHRNKATSFVSTIPNRISNTSSPRIAFKWSRPQG